MRRATFASYALNRRVAVPAAGSAGAASTAVGLSFLPSVCPQQTAVQRNYAGPLDIFWSLFGCFFCTCAGASWGNNIYGLNKYGLFRFYANIDNSMVVESNRTAMTIGGILGFLLWWNVVGPMKYWRTDMEKWAKRYGPF